ncbi:hypothetical protein IWW50_002308 [Coemansia erecta]|nr:hypothetical protein GGF43_001925 [Coemansia sp. RSA 2618]KAJ2826545.1 hypothetical protein IWW50_002308 [Coemansia erecta]
MTNDAGKNSLEEELNKYRSLLTQPGIANEASLALYSILTHGDRLLGLRFGQAEATPGQSTTNVESDFKELREALDRAKEDVDECRGWRTRAADRVKELQTAMGLERRGQTQSHVLSSAKDDLKEAKAEYNDALDRRDKVLDRYNQAMADAKARVDEAIAAADARADEAIAAADAQFEKAKAAFAAMGAVPRRGNIFDAMKLDQQDLAVSSHRPKLSKFKYLFVHDPTIAPAARKFQARCADDRAVNAFVVPEVSKPTATAEKGFTQLVIADLGPRLDTLLCRVLGLNGVCLRQLGPNYGVDLELVGHKDHALHPVVATPVEVKRNFGQAPATGDFAIPKDIPARNFRLNRSCLENMAKKVGGRNLGNLLAALTQTASYIEDALFSNNRGIIIGRDGVVLLHRTNRNMVLVSDIISYTGTDPHPAAAIAYWVSEVLDNPCRTIEQSGSVESGNAQGDSGRHSTISLLTERVQRMTTRSKSKQGQAPGTQSATQGAPSKLYSGGAQQHKSNPTDACAFDMHDSNLTAVGMEFAAENLGDDPLEGKYVELGDGLTFEHESRCGMVYSGWLSDGQRAVVKATPQDDEQLMDELRAEVRAYHRLRDLQGLVVPRIISYGYADIGERKYGVLVAEYIGDGDVQSSLTMDTREELKQLTVAEKTACLNALGAIHRRGVVHGDVRGANLLLRQRGSGGRLWPVFIDFGFALLMDKATDHLYDRSADYFRLLDAFEGKSIYT